ncbi:unnamed protein product [Discosporangium mesarthrocarpum]
MGHCITEERGGMADTSCALQMQKRVAECVRGLEVVGIVMRYSDGELPTRCAGGRWPAYLPLLSLAGAAILREIWRRFLYTDTAVLLLSCAVQCCTAVPSKKKGATLFVCLFV